jgi:hypothetical protein
MMLLSFCFNSIEYPAADKETAQKMCRAVLTGLVSYSSRDKISQARFYSEVPLLKSNLAPDYTGLDFISELKNDTSSLAAFLVELQDRTLCLTSEQKDSVAYCSLQIGGDTHFSAPILKYACKSSSCVISLPVLSFWKKEKLDCWLFSPPRHQVSHNQLYNIFSEDISYLPTDPALFSLTDESRFQLLPGKRFDGQQIYRELKSGNIWYLDALHKSHYEVFDTTGKFHLGEAGLAGNLDQSKKDPQKRINTVL